MSMMGRGSDTRMYAPRSDSDHMYSANDGEDKYNPTDPEYKEKEEEKKQLKEEKKQNMRTNLKHIKIKRHHGTTMGPEPDMTEEGQDDANKRDIDGEISRQTGSPGSRGHLLDMATGAKSGTGSAMGDSLFATGEPMDLAFRLLKNVDEKGYDFSQESEDEDIRPGESSLAAALRRRQGGSRFTPTKQLSKVKGVPTGKRLNVSTTEHLPPPPSKEEKLHQSIEEIIADQPNIDIKPFKRPDEDDEITMSEPMDLAWRLLKAKKEKPFHGYNPKKHSKKGGLNDKGRAAAKRKTGANLKKPVTKKPSSLKPGGKAAGRRNSFCARMTGVKGPTSKKGKLTPKGASLKRWNC